MVSKSSLTTKTKTYQVELQDETFGAHKTLVTHFTVMNTKADLQFRNSTTLPIPPDRIHRIAAVGPGTFLMHIRSVSHR